MGLWYDYAMNNSKNTIKQLALIGQTASGKTSLGVKIAQHLNAYILSLDSLSIYKEINIVSAKPSKEEQQGIKHFGIDYIYPNESFDANLFTKLYHEVYKKALHDGKNLVIVGGSSFYLKMLITGMSKTPYISEKTKLDAKKYLQNLPETHRWLKSIDRQYISKIEINDVYRIEKMLHIYLETNLTPTEYFKKFTSTPSITSTLPIYQIVLDKKTLRDRIALRTKLMIKDGLIDEICMLESMYGRAQKCMKAIGIKETLLYLDGHYTKKELEEKITTNTARLAKRQKTFNNSQFTDVIKGSTKEIEELLL